MAGLKRVRLVVFVSFVILFLGVGDCVGGELVESGTKERHDDISRALYQYLLDSNVVEHALLEIHEKKLNKGEASRSLAAKLARRVPPASHILSGGEEHRRSFRETLGDNHRFQQSALGMSLRANAGPRDILKAHIKGGPSPLYAEHWDSTSSFSEPNKKCRDLSTKYRAGCLGST